MEHDDHKHEDVNYIKNALSRHQEDPFGEDDDEPLRPVVLRAGEAVRIPNTAIPIWGVMIRVSYYTSGKLSYEETVPLEAPNGELQVFLTLPLAEAAAAAVGKD